MLKNNQTFCVAEPTWANACVGNNGNPQQLEYAEGFTSAAEILMKTVLADRGMKLYVDDFIYPICFNMRHAVELYLKAVAEQVKRMGTYRDEMLEFDGKSTHDLGKIWTFVKSNAVNADRRFLDLIDQLEPYINDIAEVDPTGQVFRYPYSNEDEKHLVEESVINIVVLYQRFQKLKELLKSLYRLGDTLVEEYSWQTYTAKLSRDDLFSIALVFPERQGWDSDAFTERQNALMATYGLGKRDFSKALNLVQQNYEMAVLIGAPVALQSVDQQLLRDFFEFWAQEHDLEMVRNPPPPQIADFSRDDLFEGMRRRVVTQVACWERIGLYLSAEKLAELYALYYFHRQMQYSEVFIREREIALREFQADKAPEGERLKEALLHLLDKTNALENILNSLNFLGQRPLVAMLLKDLGIQDAAERLLEHSVARSWISRRLGGTGIA
jgi:HEPN domain-containing protein